MCRFSTLPNRDMGPNLGNLRERRRGPPWRCPFVQHKLVRRDQFAQLLRNDGIGFAGIRPRSKELRKPTEVDSFVELVIVKDNTEEIVSQRRRIMISSLSSKLVRTEKRDMSTHRADSGLKRRNSKARKYLVVSGIANGDCEKRPPWWDRARRPDVGLWCDPRRRRVREV